MLVRIYNPGLLYVRIYNPLTQSFVISTSVSPDYGSVLLTHRVSINELYKFTIRQPQIW